MTPQDMIDYAEQAGIPQPPIQNPVIAEAPPVIYGGAGKQKMDRSNILGSIGSYLNAAGQGMIGAQNMAQGFGGAMGGVNTNMQNIRNFETMSPYYNQMGYDVTRLDPRRGGGGVGSTPESMINLQSQVDQRAMNNLYRQQMIESLRTKQDASPTVGDLMMYNPQFRQQMQGQFDFSGGKNADILKRPVPAALLQNMLPKNVNMNYAGGLNSTKTSKATITHSSGGGGGGKSGGKPKLIF